MAQNHDAPAYQEYSPNMLADLNFRMMPLAARGLLYTLRLECWLNKMPSDPTALAKVLGISEDEIVAAWSYLEPFFEEKDGFLVCKDLEKYRVKMLDRRAALSKGGKNSAESKKKRQRSESPPLQAGKGDRSSVQGTTKNLASSRQDGCKLVSGSFQANRLDELRVGQPNPPPPGGDDSIEEGIPHVNDFYAGDYDRASNGG